MDVDPAAEGGAVVSGGVVIQIEVGLVGAFGLILLGQNQRRGVKGAAGYGAVLRLVVHTQRIGTVVEVDVDVVGLHRVSIPVRGVGNIAGHVLLGEVLNQVSAAVSNVGRSGAVVAGGVLLALSAEGAALSLVESPVQRSEAAVAHHGQECGEGLLQSVLQGVVVNSLDADLGEIGNLTAQVSIIVLDAAAIAAGHQIAQSIVVIENVLHGSDPVISGHFAQLTTLLVNPLHALTQVEGVNSAVLGNLIALGNTGLLHVLGIVLQQRSPGRCDEVVVRGITGGNAIPGSQLIVNRIVPGVIQGVAVLVQVSLGSLEPGSSVFTLAPQSGQSRAILRGDQLVGNQLGVPSVLVNAPGSGGIGTGNHTVHSESAAVAVHRGEDAGLHQLGVRHSHLGHTQIQVGDLRLGVLIVFIEFAQVPVIQSIGSIVVIHSVDSSPVRTGIDVTCRFSGSSGLGGSRSRSCCRGGGAAAAGRHGKHHGQSKQQGQKFFHCSSSFFILQEFEFFNSHSCTNRLVSSDLCA